MIQFEEQHLNPIFIDHTFSDFNLFLDSVQGWDLEFTKLDKAPFDAKTRQIISANISLMDVKINSHLDQHGHPPHGVRTIAIPADPNQYVYWRKKIITNNRIGIWPLEGDLDAVSKVGFHVYTLSIPEEFLISISQTLGIPTLAEMLKEEECLDISQLEMTKLRIVLANFLNHMFINPELLTNDRSRKNAEFEIARSFLLTIASSQVEAKIPPSRFRDKAMQRALDYITSNAHKAPQIADVYDAAYASERTLQYAFLERFGVTPKSYLESFRLNGVRKELHISDSTSTKIKEVAKRWGFWHMSKFASDYHKLFGKLPSDTLRGQK